MATAISCSPTQGKNDDYNDCHFYFYFYFHNQCERFNVVVFQYYNGFTILHLIYTYAWLLAPFTKHFYLECTMSGLINATALLSFTLLFNLKSLIVLSTLLLYLAECKSNAK